MDQIDEQGHEQVADNEGGTPHQQPRRRDRRMDTASLFGGYNGPERRSGQDRRGSA